MYWEFFGHVCGISNSVTTVLPCFFPSFASLVGAQTQNSSRNAEQMKRIRFSPSICFHISMMSVHISLSSSYYFSHLLSLSLFLIALSPHYSALSDPLFSSISLSLFESNNSLISMNVIHVVFFMWTSVRVSIIINHNNLPTWLVSSSHHIGVFICMELETISVIYWHVSRCMLSWFFWFFWTFLFLSKNSTVWFIGIFSNKMRKTSS